MNSRECLDNWYNTESPNTKAYEYEQHYRIIKKDLDLFDEVKTLMFTIEDDADLLLKLKRLFVENFTLEDMYELRNKRTVSK